MTYKIIAILGSLIVLSSCIKKNNDAFKVTYCFNFLSEETCRVLVIYKDSANYISFYTDKNWVKEVSLSSEDMASLLIIPQKYYKAGENNNEEDSLFSKSRNVSIRGQIIHSKKTVTGNGKDNINISLFPKDIQ